MSCWEWIWSNVAELILASRAFSVCWLESVEKVSESRFDSLVANVCSFVRIVPSVESVFVVVVLCQF